jgi:hypothetical protein
MEKRQENGQEIEVSKTIKKAKPIKVALSKPDRKKYKEAEIFYAKKLSSYLKEGLLPISLVSKRYMNDGGPLTDNEKEFISSLRERYAALQKEYFEMPTPLTDDNTKRRSEIILEMNQINKVLREFESSYEELFSNTAEAKSKNDTIEWWILNLSCIDENGGGYKLFYGDGDFDSKMKKLEDLEAKDDEFINEVIRKLSYFISFWNSAGIDISQEDFKSAEEHYNNNVTKYSVEETPKDKVEEKTETAAVISAVAAPATT